jgi:gluconate kinase
MARASFLTLFLLGLAAVSAAGFRQSPIPILVLFGKPGCGKSTTATFTLDRTPDCVGLDLDVCISDEMKANFVKGIYPTSNERIEFMERACDYVEQKLSSSDLDTKRVKSCLITFSFVNEDTRDVFRRRFPGAKWFLLDLPNAAAEERINARQGHFYKGGPKVQESQPAAADTDDNTSEWEFQPVNFEHVVLNGFDEVSVNAAKIVAEIQRQTQ